MAKTLVGLVTSNKTDKTIIVTVHTAKTHPLYKKQYTVSTKFMAHDEKNDAQIGDKVAIIESRPLSARKRFTLERIIQKPAIREVEALADEPVIESKKKSTPDDTPSVQQEESK